MSAKRLLDAAAIFKATHSVASKHAALRNHQFEAYQKTSSLAKAVKNQTDRVTLTVKAASALAGRLQESGDGYRNQSTSTKPSHQARQVPSHNSVQAPESAPAKKEGLEQDHFYERSSQNSTTQPPPEQDIGVKQETAKRYPLPDGSIPPLGSNLTSSTPNEDSHSSLQQTEPSKAPLTEENGSSEANLEPVSSRRTSIPEPSSEQVATSPGEARRLQRQAERQIPSQAAEPPPAGLGVNQDQDVFYTRSQEAGDVLSALPRVKLPKNTVDEQNSTNRVPEESINQDVFYSRAPDAQKRIVPEHQAIPQQNELSDEMYSELFHSPKVAKTLKGQPMPADYSEGLNMEGVKNTPVEEDHSTSRGDPESFNTRPTAGSGEGAADTQKFSDQSLPPQSPAKDDVQALAADIAADAAQGQTNADGVRTANYSITNAQY
ncbi:MAG: hypothetical protein Q9200_007118 [Gallowayella weberi]